MAILSIQSHVAYGYVGNKAAVYPLQSMGYDVWPVNTVQFSNHTGYGKWQGEIFPRDHIRSVIEGIVALGVVNQCQAVLSGYMGSREICHEVQDTVKQFKSLNSELLYLCDPVIGNTSCFVKPEVLDFFKTNLRADIITPNQFEAETLSGITIETSDDLKRVADYFHALGVNIVIITGVRLQNALNKALLVFLSDKQGFYAIQVKEYAFSQPPNGTGDLFSAIFLGYYLASKSALTSLQRSVLLTDQVMKNTFDAKSRELKVLSVNYTDVDVSALPEFVAL